MERDERKAKPDKFNSNWTLVGFVVQTATIMTTIVSAMLDNFPIR